MQSDFLIVNSINLFKMSVCLFIAFSAMYVVIGLIEKTIKKLFKPKKQAKIIKFKQDDFQARWKKQFEVIKKMEV